MNKRVFIVNKDGKIQQVPKPLSPREKDFDENFLQKLIFDIPELLPVETINSNYSKLVPINREISVQSGAIDVLYITPDGTICIVETKLWRNPEAHRTVLAQIIEYARDLSSKSFDEFCEIATKEKQHNAVTAFFRKVKTYTDFNEEELQSNIQQSLENGRFLLLIVGDKIFPEVVLLKEAISSAPNLEFNIQAIELHFFRFENNPDQYLIVPQIVGKTKEETRAVVKIRYEEKKPGIHVTAIDTSGPAKIGKTTEKEFLSLLPDYFADKIRPFIEKWERGGYVIYWGTTGFSVRTNLQGKLETVFDIYPTNMSILTEKRCKSANLPEDICAKYREAVRDILAVNRTIAENKVYVYYNYLSADEFGKILLEMDKTLLELSEKFKK